MTHLLRPALAHTTNGHLLEATHEARIVTVDLVLGLASCQADLERIRNNNIVSGINWDVSGSDQCP
jgi:hypothetical protein